MRILILMMIIGVVYAIVDPQYHGLVDMRYMKSTNAYQGLGTFAVNDLALNVKFPLQKNYLVYYETHLTTPNGQVASQLYVDIDGMPVPGNLRIGRFRVPFGYERSSQWDRTLISQAVCRSALWSTGNVIIPQEENGINYYFHSRPFSADIYLVNGKGELYSIGNPNESKSLGADMRFLLKDFLDVGFSLYYGDASSAAVAGSQYLLVGTDYQFSLSAFDVAFAYVMATGKQAGVGHDANGLTCEVTYHVDTRLALGAQYSSFGADIMVPTATDSRWIGEATYQLSPEMMLRLESLSETVSGVADAQLQVQLLVRM